MKWATNESEVFVSRVTEKWSHAQIMYEFERKTRNKEREKIEGTIQSANDGQ